MNIFIKMLFLGMILLPLSEPFAAMGGEEERRDERPATPSFVQRDIFNALALAEQEEYVQTISKKNPGHQIELMLWFSAQQQRHTPSTQKDAAPAEVDPIARAA